MKCVIYARISPTKKGDDEDELARSINEQIEICRKRALGDDNEIVEEYIDQYKSGDHKYMEDFNRMIHDAKRGKFKRIYCRRVDRFGRNLNEMIKTEIDLYEMGISIYFKEETIDTSSQFGRMMMQMLSHISEWKREEIRNNTKKGRERLRRDIEAGRTEKRFGRKPKELDIKEVVRKKNNGMIWKDISDIVGLSVPIIQKRLKDEGYYFNKGKIER